MEELLIEILEKNHYARFKYVDQDACILLPILYHTEETFVMYNKSGLDIEKGRQVAISVSNDIFEFVIKGVVEKNDKNISVAIHNIEKYRNRRKNSRYDLNLDTQIIVDGMTQMGKIVNVSDSGALIHLEGEVTMGGKIEFELANENFEANVLRTEIRNNKPYYGVKFINNVNILAFLKNVPSFDMAIFNERSIYVFLDDISDVSYYKNVFERNISVNFINVNAGCESFIVDYYENKREEMILLDMVEESNVLDTVEKLNKYLDAQQKVSVLIRDHYSDELLTKLQEQNISFVLKEFIAEEIKNLLMKMS